MDYISEDPLFHLLARKLYNKMLWYLQSFIIFFFLKLLNPFACLSVLYEDGIIIIL